MNIFIHAQKALIESSIHKKIELVANLYTSISSIDFVVPTWDTSLSRQPGRPSKPELVLAKLLPKRSVATLQGRAALMHSIAHIEFNAINLALDALCRFKGLPDEYYLDWLCVAYEESQHFLLCEQYLITHGFNYGDFNAHNGLWEMAQKTAHCPLVRMALVPRILEARGLDVTPMIIEKFNKVHDLKAKEILTLIEEEEVKHVKIGNKWYKFLCSQQNLNPLTTFRDLILKYAKNYIKLPLATTRRMEAGFNTAELNMLKQLAT